jgi:periplasmic protein TonB
MNDFGNLSQCMVDSDPDALARGRQLRRKAVVISTLLEAICLAGMLMWPLVGIGVLPRAYTVTPLPPYRGGGGLVGGNPPRHTPNTTRRFGAIMRAIVFLPPEKPSHLESTEEAAPEIGAGQFGSTRFGLGSEPAGPILPGGLDNPERTEPPGQLPAPRNISRKTLSEGVMAGELVRRVDPVYPEIARAMHLSGTVRLHAIIATDGTVEHLELLSGSPILARAAEDAVRQWRYRPTLLSGIPVEVETYITVNFVLGP